MTLKTGFLSHLSVSRIADPAMRRPLPDIPTSEEDSGANNGSSSLLAAAPGGGGGSNFGSLDNSMRWSSRENLLTAASDEDPQLFVALYDFQAGGENQLSLKKGNDDTRIRMDRPVFSVKL